ncbi:MAG: hypothetical protein HUJ53_02310, partial [Holdemanella sp.]|nr:hypothetical protein [Holdemanella sp.]
MISESVEEALLNLEREFGKTDYGKNKYSSEALFWMGYLYRYISYTREMNTPLILRRFPLEQLNELSVRNPLPQLKQVGVKHRFIDSHKC